MWTKLLVPLSYNDDIMMIYIYIYTSPQCRDMQPPTTPLSVRETDSVVTIVTTTQGHEQGCIKVPWATGLQLYQGPR